MLGFEASFSAGKLILIHYVGLQLLLNELGIGKCRVLFTRNMPAAGEINSILLGGTYFSMASRSQSLLIV
jgi:hypothetical protein